MKNESLIRVMTPIIEQRFSDVAGLLTEYFSQFTPHALKPNKEFESKIDEINKLSQEQFEDNHGVLVTNPPYGERIETSEDIVEFYQMIGTTLKHNFHGYTAWIISSNFEAMKLVGLRPSKKYTLYNGALQCKYHKYELYAGSKKGSKQ